MSSPILFAAAAWLSALLAAAVLSAPASAQDVTRLETPVPATRYTSALDQYRPLAATPHPPSHNWVRLNKEVGELDSMSLTMPAMTMPADNAARGETPAVKDRGAAPDAHEHHKHHQMPARKEPKP